MRVTLITVGSRGDVQPYVALGIELAARGHVVTVATHELFRDFVITHGLAFAPLAGDPLAIVGSAEEWLERGRTRDALGAASRFFRARAPLIAALLADYWRVGRGADALIYSTVAAPAWSVAERLGIPGIAACLQPLHRTREFPIIAVPTGRSLGGRLNAASYDLVSHLAWQSHRRAVNTWRCETLGLDPIPWRGPFAARAAAPTVYGYSSLVVPRPADWDSHVQVTGYWVLPPDPAWRPAPELASFLAAGEPPIYMGFGSMTPRHAEHLTAVAVDALERTGQRGVLLNGWGNFGSGTLTDSVLAVREVPHEWLFPRMRGIVHHGGSGTTGAALRSGVPSILVPLGFDQPYWGRRVTALGVGPPPVPRRRLTSPRLADAITRVVHDDAMRRRAATLGGALRSEHGTARAVDIIERIVAGYCGGPR